MDEANPQAPLASLRGQVPAAPGWFTTALAQEPERTFITVSGAPIEMLAWGARGAPGLLFVHGHAAHADWWSFIAPFFARDYRVVALSWSGMGRSGRRSRYSLDLISSEFFAAATVGGLFDAGAKPIFVGHSAGGALLIGAAAHLGDRLRGVICIDTVVPRLDQLNAHRARPVQAHRIYPSLTEALSRFRFSPLQICDNLYIADFLARGSLSAEVSTIGDAAGWTWRFDPFFWKHYDPADTAALLPQIKCPMALLWGERSALMTLEMRRKIRELAPTDTPMIGIPGASHHVMVDQPLALVGTLRGLLAGWPQQQALGGK